MSIPEVTFFTRRGCHLCEGALEEVRALAGAGLEFSLDVVDIESSDELLRAHLERIPVVVVDGIEVSALEFDRDAFARAVGSPPGGSGQVA